MNSKPIAERYSDYLSTLSLNDLRTFGRFQGVQAATQRKKEDLIDEIIKILLGKVKPTLPKTDARPVGAPPKSSTINPDIMPKLDEIRKKYEMDQREREFVMSVASDEKTFDDAFDIPVYSGILDFPCSRRRWNR